MIEEREKKRTEAKIRRKKRRSPQIKQLDDEDLELVAENVGMEPAGGKTKKNRLKRTGALEAEQEVVKAEPIAKRETQPEAKTEQIDTHPPKRDFEQMEVERPIPGTGALDPDRLRKAQTIFGDDSEMP